MASITAKLSGTRALKRIMQRYPDKVEKQVKFTLRVAGLAVRDGARKRAPVDTGNLVSSIQVDFKELDKLYVQVYSALEYARRQELGFTGTDSLGRSYDQPGRYFMTRAAREKKRTFSKEIGKAVRRARP